MSEQVFITDLGGGWQKTVTVFEADVLVNPPRWQFWRTPWVQKGIYTSITHHKKQNNEMLIHRSSLSVEVISIAKSKSKTPLLSVKPLSRASAIRNAQG